MDLEERLSRLERSNARLRRMLLMVPLLALAPLLLAYVPANDKIEASEFVVRDKAGSIRARVYIDEHGDTRLLLRDRDGKSQALLTSGSGASLSLGDKDGKSNVVIGAGSAAKGVIVLEHDGKPKTWLGPSLDVQDPWASPD